MMLTNDRFSFFQQQGGAPVYSALTGTVVEWSLCGGEEFRLDNQWIKGLILRQQNSAGSSFPAVFAHVWP